MMRCSSKIRRIASNLLLRGGELLSNPIVEVDERGMILSVVTDRNRRCGVAGSDIDSSVHTEFYSGIMLAGFVNAHAHTELSYLKGAIEQGGGFAHFASKIGAVRDSFTAEERQRAMVQADAEMVREGIVAVGDIVNGVTSFEMKGRSAIHYINFAELFGLRSQDMSAIEPLLQRGDSIATPHSLYSLNDPILRSVAQMERGELPLSIHFMESESELQLFERKGGLYEWYEREGFECDFLHYGSPAERLVSVVPADRSVMLVHNCYVRQSDIDLIMSHFTAPVYWVVCPRSNRYISEITPPIELLQSNNLNICIGTDSLASNGSLSILEELKLLDGVPLAQRLDWATRVGAAALSLDELGDIEVGRAPHINILSGVDYDSLQLTPSSRLSRVL